MRHLLFLVVLLAGLARYEYKSTVDLIESLQIQHACRVLTNDLSFKL